MRKQFLKCTTAFLLTFSLLVSLFPLLVGAEEKDTSQPMEGSLNTVEDVGVDITPIEPLVPEAEPAVMAYGSTVNTIGRTPGSSYYRAKDWFDYSVPYTDDYVYLSSTDEVVDGVYEFESISEEFCGIFNAFYTNEPVGYGYAMQYGHFNSEIPVSISYFDQYACFKVTKKPGTNYYIIRWMNNHLYGFSGSGGTLSVKALPYDDSQVALADTFSITYEGNGFVIKPYGYTTAISAPADTSVWGEELEMLNPASAGDRCKWNLVRYTGCPMYGMSIYEEYTELENEGVTAGETLSVKITAFSTDLQANEPHVTIDSSTASKATVSWDSTTQVATIFGRDEDLGTLNISIRNTSGDILYTYVRDFYIDLPIHEGVFYLQNKQLGNYMQIDDGDDDNNYQSNGAFMELHEYTGQNYQRWRFEHDIDGYYIISSVISGKVLTVPQYKENTSGEALTQTTDGFVERQRWKVEKTASGSFIIRPKSGEGYATDWCMSAGTGIIWSNGRNVEQRAYTNDGDYKDEWYLKELKLTIKPFFDYAMYITFPTASDVILQILTRAATLFEDEFDLKTEIISPEMVYTTPYYCTLAQGGQITALNPNEHCPANPFFGQICPYCSSVGGDRSYCTNCDQVFNDFLAIDEHRGDSTTVTMLFNKHRFYLSGSQKLYDRSYFLSTTGAQSTQSICIVDRGSSGTVNKYLQNYLSTTIHELSHAIGARDHYHEKETEVADTGKCEHYPICSTCGSALLKRPAGCIMEHSNREDLWNENFDAPLYCTWCKMEIFSHLRDHHAN